VDDCKSWMYKESSSSNSNSGCAIEMRMESNTVNLRAIDEQGSVYCGGVWV
jgi:hypothetical protein